uniref:Helicase-associated putative binding domain-containing protein n=1 Tax=Electrophorus electricus TaxID=8005 RepID=A0A4W4EXE4_ELEEL
LIVGVCRVQGQEGSPDSMVDQCRCGLQEVRYTHSNQKVVGSSRMENRLSRAALRDVFKLNKHSQLPANHLSDLSEGPSPAEHYITQQVLGLGCTLSNVHSKVVHSIRASHRTPSVTLSVGQTPAAVRKNQLEEMARFFGARCVRAFAEELVESTCNAAKQGPTSKRSLLTSVQRSHEKVLEEAGVASKKKRMTNARHTKDLSNRCMGPPELRTETISPPESGQSLSELPQEPYSGVQPQSQANPSPMTPLGRVNPSPLRRTRKDQVSPAEFSRTDLAEPGPARANKTFITDLIGDTSILDDLLKPKRSGERLKLATAPMAAPTERVKNKGKDFWDILNEGNIESIDKLTDLSQVEKVCRSAAVSGRSKRENELESSQLWKKNEKFLWKR